MVRRFSAALLLASALLVLTPGLANAAPATDYVALGDSYSSGTGAGRYDLSASCQRSSDAYPALWARQFGTSTFTFAACAGATSDSVVSGQLSGLSADTDLVTVTSGGNDAGFVNVVLACRLGSDSSCFTELDNAERYVADTLPGKLDNLYGSIRSRAASAVVVVLGYPRLYETTRCPGAISLARRERVNEVADVLNAAISARAQASGFVFADVSPGFEGRRICGSPPWINGPTVPLSSSYHPNGSGHSSGYLPALSSVAR